MSTPTHATGDQLLPLVHHAGDPRFRALFEGIVSISADAIVTIDDQHRIVLFNRGAEEIFGYDAEELLGEPLDILIPPAARATHGAEIARFSASPVASRRMGERREIYGLRKSGELFPAEASISKIDVDGRRFFTAVLRDTSARKAAEDAMRRLLATEESARHSAERASHLRDELLGAVSHDLRNPLSAILMCAATLAGDSTGTAADTRALAETIRESAEWMHRLIADLLDVASIEAGRLSIERRAMDPVVAIVQAVSMFEPIAARRELTLEARLPEHLPRVPADAERIVQVLSNLLGNAVKFTPQGGRLAVEADATPEQVRIRVSDTGPGIPPDELPHIFDRFWHSRRNAAVSSTGLGLAIALGIAKAHGGSLTVESEVGRGSTFIFTLPRTPDSGPGAERRPVAGPH